MGYGSTESTLSWRRHREHFSNRGAFFDNAARLADPDRLSVLMTPSALGPSGLSELSNGTVVDGGDHVVFNRCSLEDLLSRRGWIPHDVRPATRAGRNQLVWRFLAAITNADAALVLPILGACLAVHSQGTTASRPGSSASTRLMSQARLILLGAAMYGAV
jgi:hypothetical protein